MRTLLFACVAVAAALSSPGSAKPAREYTTLGEIDSEISSAAATLADCVAKRGAMRDVLENDNTLVVSAGDRVRVVTRARVAEMIARIQLFHLMEPDLVPQYLPAIAEASGIPEFLLTMLLEGEGGLSGLAVDKVFDLLKEQVKDRIEQGRRMLGGVIIACDGIERLLATELDALKKRRAELEQGPPPQPELHLATYKSADLMIDGAVIDVCLEAERPGIACDPHRSAIALCKFKGHLTVVTFPWGPVAPTIRLNDRVVCTRDKPVGPGASQGHCQGWTEVTCE